MIKLYVLLFSTTKIIFTGREKILHSIDAFLLRFFCSFSFFKFTVSCPVVENVVHGHGMGDLLANHLEYPPGVCDNQVMLRTFTFSLFIISFSLTSWLNNTFAPFSMSRWTTNGWVTCLGAGFQYSFWDKREGPDFLLETQARTGAGTDEKYQQLVQRLEWLASFYGESNITLIRKCFPDKCSPFLSLALMQKKSLALSATSGTCAAKEYIPSGPVVMTQLEKITARSDSCETIATTADGTIIIPATLCSNPKQPTNTILFLKSFLGGTQLHMTSTNTVEYTLSTDQLPSAVFKYNITCRVCTVHRNEKPLLVKLLVDGACCNEYQLTLPYTMGSWEETTALEIDLGTTNVASNVCLSLTRQTGGCGIAIKDIKLILL
jgi:hypothetical protein